MIDQKRLLRAIETGKVVDEKSLAIFQILDDVTEQVDRMDEIKKSIAEKIGIIDSKIDEAALILVEKADKDIAEKISQVKTIKGDQGEPGYTPVKGKDYFDGATGANAEPIDIDDIASRASEMANEKIKPFIPTIEALENNLPKLGERIRDSLELLKEDERLDISALKGVEQSHTTLSDAIIQRAIGIVDQRTSYLIQKVANLSDQVSQNTTGANLWTRNVTNGYLYPTNLNDNIGIGTATPQSMFHIVTTSTTTPRGILADQVNDGTSGSRITMRKARGTPTALATIVTGDTLGSFTVSGHDGTNYVDNAKIIVTSTGTVGTGIVPSTMQLQTMTAAGVMTTGIMIDSKQFIGLGTTTPLARLHFAGDISSVSWGLTGIAIEQDAATYTDTSTANGGTVGHGAINALAVPVIASTGTTVTYTNASTLYIAGTPTNGTNVTIANAWSLYIASGQSFYSGLINANGGIQSGTSTSNANFRVTGVSNGLGVNAAVTNAQFIPTNTGVSITNIMYRTFFYGSTSTTLGANNSYGSVIFGNTPVTTTTSGTNNLLANVIIRPLSISVGGGSTITNSASLYIDGAATGATNNYALWIASGISLFGGDIKIGTVGSGLYIKEGTNATMGTATLVGGTLVVSTNKVTANSRIFLQSEGGTVTNLGTIYVSARSAGTSFTVTSSNVLDTQTFVWVIVEPA